MEIADNILKHYLRNCYFINGTAYAVHDVRAAGGTIRYAALRGELWIEQIH